MLSECDDTDIEFFERRLFRVVHCSSTSIRPSREDLSSDSSDCSTDSHEPTSLAANAVNIIPVYDKCKTLVPAVCDDTSVCISSNVTRFEDELLLCSGSFDDNDTACVVPSRVLSDYSVTLSLFLSYYDADNKCFDDGICGPFAEISEMCSTPLFADILDRLHSRCSSGTSIDGKNFFKVDDYGFSMSRPDPD